jgi:hypothetical protein
VTCTFELRAERLTHRPDVNRILHLAVKNGDIETVRSLLAANPLLNVNFENDFDDCKTPLDAACYGHNVEIAKFLVANGATSTHIALDYAVRNKNLELVIDLVENSRDKVNYVNSLERAGFEGFGSNFVDILANPGDRVDDQDNVGNTALHLACEKNIGVYVEWLLNNNADPSKRNFQNETAWEVAVKSSSYDAIGVFAFKEMKRQRDSSGSGDILFFVNGERDSSNIMRYQPGNTWHHCGGDNSVSRNLGHFAVA